MAAAIVLFGCTPFSSASERPSAAAPTSPGSVSANPATDGSSATPTFLVEQRESFEQTFGPDYPSLPAIEEGQAARVEQATLSPDGLTLTVQFDGGGSPYLASDPCSSDYEPWLEANGDELDVVVFRVHHANQATFGPNQACAGVGHLWTYHLQLREPFRGTTVNDVAGGGTLFVGGPPGTAHLGALPEGWTLQSGFQLEAGPPPIWAEIYGPEPVEFRPDERPGRLSFYQAFGIVSEWTDTRAVKSQDRGGNAVAVTFRGRQATVWFDAAIGELLLGWDADGRSYGLIGNSADMSVDDLVRYAESASIP